MAKRRTEEGAQFVKYFGPILEALRKLGGSGTPDEVVEQIATDLELSDQAQNDLLPSGEPRFRNQVAWGRFYLVREGLLDSSKRGVWSLTERGLATTLHTIRLGSSSSGGSRYSKSSAVPKKPRASPLPNEWPRGPEPRRRTTALS